VSLGVQRVGIELAVLDASRGDDAQRVLASHRTRTAYGYHRSDEGQAAAIQEGWNQTAGEVVGWLNADDYYFRSALERVADVFATRPEVDVVFGHAVHVSADGDFLTYFPAIDPEPGSLTRGCSICQPSCFVRRRAMECVGGLDERLQFTMDWDFWLRLYHAGSRFAFVDAPLSAVRVHPAMKTLSRAPRRYREIADLLTEAGVSSASRCRTLLNFYRYDLQNCRTRLFDRATYEALTVAWRAYRRFNPRRSRMIGGVECWTNMVRSECQIALPWYGQESAIDVNVITDRPIDLTYASGGADGALLERGSTRVVFQGAETSGYLYAGRIPMTSGDGLVFRLNANGSPWRLLRAAIEPPIRIASTCRDTQPSLSRVLEGV
jgi:hypothetical protein